MDLSGKDASGHDVVNIKELIDYDSLLERVGGDTEFLNELFDIFLEDSSNLLKEIKENIDQNDHEALSRTAHKLKGSISNFVPQGPIFDAAKFLEFAGRDNRMQEAKEGYGNLETQLATLHSSIRYYADQQ